MFEDSFFSQEDSRVPYQTAKPRHDVGSWAAATCGKAGRPNPGSILWTLHVQTPVNLPDTKYLHTAGFPGSQGPARMDASGRPLVRNIVKLHAMEYFVLVIPR